MKHPGSKLFAVLFALIAFDLRAAQPGILTETDDETLILDVDFSRFKERDVKKWPAEAGPLFGDPTPEWKEHFSQGFRFEKDGPLFVNPRPGASTSFLCAASVPKRKEPQGIMIRVEAAPLEERGFEVRLRITNAKNDPGSLGLIISKDEAGLYLNYDGGKPVWGPKKVRFEPVSWDPDRLDRSPICIQLIEWKRVVVTFGKSQLYDEVIYDEVIDRRMGALGCVCIVDDGCKSMAVKRVCVSKLIESAGPPEPQKEEPAPSAQPEKAP